jgi:mannan endo-1,4-beta-mannosidase
LRISGRNKLKSKIVASLFGLILIVSILSYSYSTDITDYSGNGNNGNQVRETNQFIIADGGAYQKFTNLVDGYSISVDKGAVVDMSMSEVCTVLETQDKRIEIYKQPITGNVSRQSYINYSNGFLDNRIDHKNINKSTKTIRGINVTITEWSRDKLARVENDKNHYASIEIPVGGYVYSIFVKSSQPLNHTGGYQYLINSFETFTPTERAYMRKAKPLDVDTRGWNAETRQLYLEYFSGDSSLQWGIFEPAAPDSFHQLAVIEEAVDFTFPFLLSYTHFTDRDHHPALKQRLENAYNQNRVLELTLQTPWTSDGSGNMVYQVLNGKYDTFLKNYATTVAEFGHPVLFRLGNEMNGDWCPYSSYNTSKDTMIFKEFYWYVYDIFEKAGANNVIWVWNPNGTSFPNFKWNDANMYYPGDEYVDVIGLTAYNTGTYYPGETWTEFHDLYDSLYEEYNRLYDKPMMITEFASSSVGGDKAQWIRNMFSHIGKYENIKIAIWWDGSDRDAAGNIARPYFIDEFPEILEIFREYLNKKPWYVDVYG